MSEIVDIFVSLESLDDPVEILAARALGRRRENVGSVRVLRRSLDARKRRHIGYQFRVEVGRPGETLLPPVPSTIERVWPASVPRPRVVVVGSGPAGLWAALRLADAGVPSTILERGQEVGPRRRDLAELHRGRLNPHSNYCFGEGGAGTYSDGKLYTRSKDRQGIAQILADLVRFGAPEDIQIDSRPHLGSNRLPKMLAGMRVHLENKGVRYCFDAVFSTIVQNDGRIAAVRTTAGEEIPADIVILATGHSARDVYEWASSAGIALERKGSAVGVRIEHPQELIDRIQYGAAAGHPKLPPAFYELRASGAGRGVYSFCMCPGGWIVPAATEQDGVVVNGMSLAKRNSPLANSAIVVATNPGDFGPDARGPLAGVEFQRHIERAAFRAGGGGFRAPAEKLTDFLAKRPSGQLPKSSYRPGLQHARLDEVLPEFITASLREGLAAMANQLPGFLHPDAILIAAETRTSAPVRILRDSDSLQSPSLENLYPAGEGAGYAGGIVSSALDGMRIAEAILKRA
jgi:uncharacterized FAD-dependent dehydrogenase